MIYNGVIVEGPSTLVVEGMVQGRIAFDASYGFKFHGAGDEGGKLHHHSVKIVGFQRTHETRWEFTFRGFAIRDEDELAFASVEGIYDPQKPKGERGTIKLEFDLEPEPDGEPCCDQPGRNPACEGCPYM